jgi:3-deoxy-7-phosphoheptulonate synthase
MSFKAPTLRHATTERSSAWHPATWREYPVAQQPPWPDLDALRTVSAELRDLPGLVTASEVYTLRRALARAAMGRAFVIQAGDCAETFAGPDPTAVWSQLDLIRDICRTVSRALGVPLIGIGRIAGQYAKPRSSPVQIIGGEQIPAFRGHLINHPEPVARLRVPDPQRLLQGYRHATRTVTLMRAQESGSAPDQWGVASGKIWTSHEALVLDFEEALVRTEEDTRSWVLTSTHFPWIGDRTRQPNGAHVAFAAGLLNPIACKVGPTAEVDSTIELCARLDPDRQPGRLTLISRMGAGQLRQKLPRLVHAVADAGHPVVWMCDPMHGNTFTTTDGTKTRELKTILEELAAFFAVLRGAGQWPGGVHLECTFDQVTECLGGRDAIMPADLARCYTTACDPRMNGTQAREVAEFIASIADGCGSLEGSG